MANFSAKNVREQWGGNTPTAGTGTSAISNLISSGKRLDFWKTTQDPDLETGETVQRESTWKFWEKQTTPEDPSLIPAMSWNKRFKFFVVLMLCAATFFSLAVVFLSMLVIRPSKFALSFTLGSMSFMAAFAMLKGPAAYLKGLMDRKNILFTTVYFLSLALTLYACLVLGSYLLVILSSILQLSALIWYAVSALPGGPASVKAFFRMFRKTATTVVRSCVRLVSS